MVQRGVRARVLVVWGVVFVLATFVALAAGTVRREIAVMVAVRIIA